MKLETILFPVLLFALSLLILSCVSGPSSNQQGKVKIFQDFESGQGLAAGDSAMVDLDKSGIDSNSTQCAKLSFETTGDPGESSQCVIVTSNDGSAIDTSDYSYLNFYILDTQGANTHKVTVLDESEAIWSGWVDIKSKKNTWVKITLSLRALSSLDRKAIKEIRIGEWNAGTYFFDNIYFSEKKTALLQ
ncbi:MAG: hypothetical protein JW969_16165 [Spirochaetales bacterium]|nr:hypothetical protein [Spirochaetales bacterium]